MLRRERWTPGGRALVRRSEPPQPHVWRPRSHAESAAPSRTTLLCYFTPHPIGRALRCSRVDGFACTGSNGWYAAAVDASARSVGTIRRKAGDVCLTQQTRRCGRMLRAQWWGHPGLLRTAELRCGGVFHVQEQPSLPARILLGVGEASRLTALPPALNHTTLF